MRVVDALAALDGVERQRDGEADQELEQHDRQHEARRDHRCVAELRRAERCQVVLEPDEDVVTRLQERVVERAGGESEEHREQDDRRPERPGPGRQGRSREPVAGGELHDSGRMLRIVTPTAICDGSPGTIGGQGYRTMTLGQGEAAAVPEGQASQPVSPTAGLRPFLLCPRRSSTRSTSSPSASARALLAAIPRSTSFVTTSARLTVLSRAPRRQP